MTSPDVRRRIAFVAAVPLSLEVFMAPHVRRLTRVHDITLVANARPEIRDIDASVKFERAPIARRIRMAGDIRALVTLWRLFARGRFDAVISITPKAGLLSMLAGALAGVPVRVHWMTGQVWATRQGLGRRVLKSIDMVMARCATHLLADSASQRDFLVRENVVRAGQVTVLASGSVCGVDTSRFRPDAGRRAAVRRRFALADDAVVALYLGRLSREKGLVELAEAFRTAAAAVPALHLLIVGPDEEGLRSVLEAAMGPAVSSARFGGGTAEPEEIMAAADFFVIPSHREGFGSTVIEAAACGIPSVATRIYGLTDAVDDRAGVLVAVRDVGALAAAMIDLAREPARRLEMGRHARTRAADAFGEAKLTGAFETFIGDALLGVPPRR